jgi:hypothetical protein
MTKELRKETLRFFAVYNVVVFRLVGCSVSIEFAKARLIAIHGAPDNDLASQPLG